VDEYAPPPVRLSAAQEEEAQRMSKGDLDTAAAAVNDLPSDDENDNL
jgi:hypothetical protein